MIKMKQFCRTLIAVAALFMGAQSALAQSPFDVVLKVNESVITRYELQQRMLFLKVLGTAGNVEKEALDRLTDERLYIEAGERFGVEATEEAIEQGMIEFAGRADLQAEEFVQALSQEGIDIQTFRDFVRAGIVWREVVGGLFGARGNVSEAELDRALSLSSNRGGVRVLLSEIILPADTPENAERAAAIANEIRAIRDQETFSRAAAQVSVAQSGPNGGRLDWLSLSDLPPPIRPILLTLAPGEISEPIDIPNAILLFQMRSIQETTAPTPRDLSVEYARLYLPGGRTPENLKEARELKYRADTCEDLYGLYEGATEQQLSIISQAQNSLPNEVAVELAKLDPGEVSSNLTVNGGQTLKVLMLCNRTAELIDDENRAEVRARLVNQRIASYADSYLAELRASAVIQRP
ncbi:peptidylprolyl isomerase [Falsihalocynthiibacter sp. SS001]|uniref:peptidylprolyl isomerase n=1 Tax=Falsihalocynthiibacter sp. SS001 TaxID=3349698 RepID=UPI0036D37F6F